MAMQTSLGRSALCSCRARARPTSAASRPLTSAQRAIIAGSRCASSSASSPGGPAPSSPSSRRLLYLSTIASSLGLLLYLTDSTSAVSSLFGSSPSSLEEYSYAGFPVLSSRRSMTSREGAAPEEGGGAGDGQHVHLRIKLPKSSSPGGTADGDSLASRLGIWSVYVKQPDLQIERPYTPLRSAPLGKGPRGGDGNDDELELLVKRYPSGEVGRWLYNMRAGSEVELRGPSQTWKASDELARSLDEIVFIAGGTGITPAYQLLTNLLGDPPRNAASGSRETAAGPRVRLLYAAPRPSSLLLLPELSALQAAHPERVDVRLFVESDAAPGGALKLAAFPSSADEEAANQGWLSSLNPFGGSSRSRQHIAGLQARQGLIAQEDIAIALDGSQSGRRIVLLCGPDGMIEAYAGPRARDGRGQGELRGVLAHLGLQKEEVFKL